MSLSILHILSESIGWRYVDGEILDEKIVSQHGCFKRVKRWIRGIHPGRGTIIRGLTGWETIEEIDVIVASKTYRVIDPS